MREIIGPRGRIPPGPGEKYDTRQNLLEWMGEQFRLFGDIYKASVYGTSVYVISDPDYVQHVLRENWQNYVKGQAIKRVALLLGNGLMVSEGVFWKSQRRMIQPAFQRKAVAGLVGVITATNTALLRSWEQAAEKGESVNVTLDVSRAVLEAVLKSIFGDDYAQVASSFNILSQEPMRNLEFAQTFASLSKVILEIASQRRAEKRASPDILGMLMEARDRTTGKPMSDRQLVNEIKTLIVAGHETTASTLNWTWYLLSQNPEVEKKLMAELDSAEARQPLDLDDLPNFPYVAQVIDETLRLYPAGWLLTRKALHDDQLGEYFVPAGTEIYVSPYFIQRHPNLWREPDRFDPDRFAEDQSQDRHPLAMLPFSVGPRNCIGELLARIEMQVHLITIARRLRLRCLETKPIELDIGVNLRSKNDFAMIPEIREAAVH